MHIPVVHPSSVAIAGRAERFSVHRIYCVGRNYAEHAREMGADPNRAPPFFFSKPADAVVPNDSSVPYPSRTRNFHYEAELVIALGKGGSDIDVARALDHVFGYAVGIDLTRRDLQKSAKDAGKPWDVSKGFDNSAPIAAIRPVESGGHVANAAIWLKVNGQLKQNANLNQMIRNVAEQISKLSEANELFAGDIIYCGTPENVGPVVRGDLIEMHIDGLPNLSVKIV